MRILKFYKFLPGGNSTILIEDQGFSDKERVMIADELMKADRLCAEQVGFISFGGNGVEPKIEMMGGEFCGNACRTFGALLALKHKLKPDSTTIDFLSSYADRFDSLSGTLLSSGIDTAIEVKIFLDKNEPSLYTSEVFICLDLSEAPVFKNGVKYLDKGAFLIELNGIVHLILDQEIYKKYDAKGQEIDLIQEAEKLRARFNLNDYTAVGVIWADLNIENCEITPVIWVKTMNTAHLETACASGSLALALYHYYNLQKNIDSGLNFNIIQPSFSVLKIFLSVETGLKAWLGGEVKFIAAGECFLDSDINLIV
ncbi:hypothetical protein [Desulfovibrio litoralis]|uniref:Diaminopimelate epimerase n=1 Tax=Desulfovibrio litoralis DSM 11393 TaxID=1121455 RepID=A0A1M7RUF3_9BACT|nr:hypothetical protein [Desulfovibrio litoralis]SHN49718.1 Diaminopimelate epimerase [Desulfovibrio litoralis DSM 11393]